MSRNITLVAGGDLAPLRDLQDCGEAVDRVWDWFRSADLAMVNLELPLTTAQGAVDKAITLKGDPAIAPSLPKCGIDLVSLANNHAMDYGQEGLAECLSVLRRAGVATVGAGMDLEDAMRAEIREVEGVRVGVLGLTSALPTGYAAGPGRPGVAPVRARARFLIDSVTLDEQPGMSPWVETSVDPVDLARVCQAVSKAKAECDVLVIQIHWGVPHGWCAAFQGPLADYQRPLGHSLMDAGADLVIGHHPHVVHGVERYGKGVVVYSLGNLLFHSMAGDHNQELTVSYPPYNLESLSTGEALQAVVMRAELEKGGLRKVTFRPIRLNDRGEPEWLTGDEAASVLARLKRHSLALGTEIATSGDEGILSL